MNTPISLANNPAGKARTATMNTPVVNRPVQAVTTEIAKLPGDWMTFPLTLVLPPKRLITWLVIVAIPRWKVDSALSWFMRNVIPAATAARRMMNRSIRRTSVRWTSGFLLCDVVVTFSSFSLRSSLCVV